MAKNKERTKGLTIGKFSISTTKSKKDGSKSKSLSIKVGDKEVYSRGKSKGRNYYKAPVEGVNVSNVSPDEYVPPSGKKRISTGGPLSFKQSYSPDTYKMKNKREESIPYESKRLKSKTSTAKIGSMTLTRAKDKYGKVKQDYLLDRKDDRYLGGGSKLPGLKVKDKTVSYTNPKKGVSSEVSRSKKKGTLSVKSSNYATKDRNRKKYYFPEAFSEATVGKMKESNKGEFKKKTRSKYK